MQNNNLLSQAIQAAKKADWTKAIDINLQLLQENPNDVKALNRLGVAYLQSNKPKKAKTTLKKVLKIDQNNKLAKKNLDKIKTKKRITVNFDKNFIEEPGKAKNVMLHRLANKTILNEIDTGSTCTLHPKNRYISIKVGSQYIGSVPEDLSFRLSKLIKNGNTYSCNVYSVDDKHCCVFIKEKKVTKKNQNIHSFPIAKSSNNIPMYETTKAVKEDIPVEIISTDDDEEQQAIN